MMSGKKNLLAMSFESNFHDKSGADLAGELTTFPDSPAGCGGDIDTQSERWTVGQTIQYNTIRYDTIQYNTSSLPLHYRPDAFCVSYSAPRLARPLH